MQNGLVGLIAEAEALEKLMCKTHHFMHLNVIFLQTSSATMLSNDQKLNCFKFNNVV